MTLEKARDVAPVPVSDPLALRRSGAIRVAIAVLVAGAATAGAIVALWGPLNVKSEIVGYPTFADFNPYNYYYAYILVAAFFPIATLLIFLALTRIGPRIGLAVPERGPLRPGAPPAELGAALEDQPAAPLTRLAGAAARVALVGAVLGLEVGIAVNHLWPAVLLLVLGYGVTLAVGSLALQRWSSARWSWESALAAANALGAPLTVAGLVLVSAHTEVRIATPSSVRHYAWFPIWLGLPVAAVLLGWIIIALRRAGPPRAVAIERRAVLLIAGAVGLFLLVAHLPGDLGHVDLFEQGQSVTETMLLGHGWLPWRDVVLTHGLLFDVAPIASGWGIFGNSYWGAAAGGTAIFYPLTIVATYLLLAYLVGRSWPLLLTGALIFIGTWLGTTDVRFVLWPLILLLMAAVLRRPTRARAAGLGLLLLGQAIATPETAPAVPIVIVLLAAYEWYWRTPDTAFFDAFRRTMWSVGGAAALAVAFAIYMASRGALGDVITVTLNLVTGHALDGALPPSGPASGVPQARLDFLALAPVAALLISFAYAAVHLRLRRPFLLADWPMAAVALFLLVYYSKFLARMDIGHADQPFAIATPLLLYITYRIATAAERWICGRLAGARAGWLTAHPVAIALPIFIVVYFWGPLHTQLDNAPAAYRPTAYTPPAFAHVGYATAFDGPAFTDLRRIIDTYARPRDRIFDFTNEPALFFYFLGRDPSSRWYAPNGIVDTAALQRDVLKDLRRSPPKLIVFDDTDTTMTGLPNMDGAPADVRMYLISQWILDHYRPLLESHGRTIYARRDLPPASSVPVALHQQPATTGVPFLGQACNWGDSPTFLTGPAEPPAGAQAVGVSSSRGAGARVTFTGWAGDVRAGEPAREVIATFNGRIVGRATPEIDRPDVPAAGYPAGFIHSGFQLSIPIWANASSALGVYAVGRDGSVAQLAVLNVPARSGRARLGNRAVALRPRALVGHVDSESSTGPVQQIKPPPGSTWSDYRWLEVDAPGSGFRRGDFALSDQPKLLDLGRAIGFGTLIRSPHRYTIPVSSCPQWHGYGSSPLFLTTLPAQPVAAVRLIR